MAHWLFHKSVAEAQWEADSQERAGWISAHWRSEVAEHRGVVPFLNQQVFMLRRDTEQSLSTSSESNPFHGSRKVLLTIKIHSSGFIRWSEVAGAPKTNRGLRSGIWNGHVPRTHHAVLRHILLVIIEDVNLNYSWRRFYPPHSPGEILLRSSRDAKNTWIKTFLSPSYYVISGGARHAAQHNVCHLDNFTVEFIF